MPGVFDKMPKKLTEMQHVFSEDMLHLRGKVGQIVPKWLARHALAVPNLPHRNPRSYDGCEE